MRCIRKEEISSVSGIINMRRWNFDIGTHRGYGIRKVEADDASQNIG